MTAIFSTKAATFASTINSAPMSSARTATSGTYFAVWAPNAEQVSRHRRLQRLEPKPATVSQPKGQSGIWEGFIPGIGKGTLYKYHIGSRFNGYRADKADPFSLFNEIPPKTASIVWDLDYHWNDRQWMAGRQQRNRPRQADGDL